MKLLLTNYKSQLTTLQSSSSKVNIRFIKHRRSISITCCPSLENDIIALEDDAIKTTKTMLNDLIHKIKQEYWVTTLNSEFIGSFIGKSGKNIQKLQKGVRERE